MSVESAINPLSLCALRTTFRNAAAETVGTSFFYTHGRDHWLVTAGHNVTGMHANTEQMLPPWQLGNRPVEMEVTGTFEAPDELGMHYRFTSRLYPLYAGNGEAMWIHHPSGFGVDMVALLVDRDDRWENTPVNSPDLPGTIMFEVVAGLDAFVLGYPLDPHMTPNAWMPTWKRATIASEPSHVGSSFLVDTTTRPGMSGAPVFARSTGVAVKYGDRTLGDRYRFMGIYANRILHDDPFFQAQIGTVFKAGAIDEMLEARMYFRPV